MQPMQQVKSKILFNAKIYTMADRVVEALAIESGIVTAVGSNDEIMELQTDDTVMFDLEGSCVLPGFGDSHMHLIATGLAGLRLDLRGVQSPDEIVERGLAYTREHAPEKGDWIAGYGFDHTVFANAEMPSKELADQISLTSPVLLERVCAHVGTLNTVGIKAAKLADFPKQELIEKAFDGTPTGVVREGALEYVKECIPKANAQTLKETLEETTIKLAASGITSVQTDDGENAELSTLVGIYRELAEQRRLAVRVYEEVKINSISHLKEVLQQGYIMGSGSDYFKMGCFKIMVDGSLGGGTALLSSNYSNDPGNCGTAIHSQTELDEMVSLIEGTGSQIAFHAIGDGALAMCLDAIEKATGGSPTKNRHRIVHCQIGTPELYSRMARLSVCGDIQPPFAHTDSAYAEEHLGKERLQHSYAWKTLIDSGIHLGGGSDSPIEPYSPLWGIYCAVTRSTESHPDGWYPEQRLTMEQAVRLYTTGSAYLSFEEGSKGTLMPGMMADLVVLSKDLFEAMPQELLDTQVLLTIMDGKIRYVCE